MRRETGRSGRFKRHIVNVSPDAWGELNPEHTTDIEINNKSGQVNPNFVVDFVFSWNMCFQPG
jgi:hypothetical protein